MSRLSKRHNEKEIMMKILLVTDVQEGFMNEATKHIPSEIIKHCKNYEYDLIIATRFINKVESLHQSELNMKHMTMFSSHAKLVEGIGELADIVLMKSTYTSLTEDVAKLLDKNDMKQVYLAGLNTESSILATSFDLFDKGIKPIILSKLCGTIKGDTVNNNALEILRYTIGEDNIL